MSDAIFPFLLGFIVGGGLVAIALHVFALRKIFAMRDERYEEAHREFREQRQKVRARMDAMHKD